MNIEPNEMKILDVLYPLINHNQDGEEVNLAINTFWQWKEYLYNKYKIDNITQYIDHDGSIVKREER